MTELGHEDIEHQQRDEHADCRVQDLLQMLDFFILLLLCLLYAA